MRRDEVLKQSELMKADVLSEIILLGSGVAVLLAFLIVVVAAITSAAAMQMQ
jgi:hypothetical protein